LKQLITFTSPAASLNEIWLFPEVLILDTCNSVESLFLAYTTASPRNCSAQIKRKFIPIRKMAFSRMEAFKVATLCYRHYTCIKAIPLTRPKH